MKIIRPMTMNDAALVSSNVAETDYTAWSGATTYALAARVIVVSTDFHKVYESVQAGNTNHNPTTDTTNTWWIEVGATNRWKMFDDLVSAQTTNADSIAVTITANGRIDSVVLLNISGATVRVTMTDAVDGLVYDSGTVSLVDDSGVSDWYAYFYEPIIRKSNIAFTDLVPYNNALIGITLSDSGATAAIGECVLGLSKEIGGTQYGASIGIQDFSVKQQDAFGNYSILERAFSKRGTFNVDVASTYVDALVELLEGYRATPAVYIGSDSYFSTIVYGFYKDFTINIDRRSYSSCTIELEGLT